MRALFDALCQKAGDDEILAIGESTLAPFQIFDLIDNITIYIKYAEDGAKALQQAFITQGNDSMPLNQAQLNQLNLIEIN